MIHSLIDDIDDLVISMTRDHSPIAPKRFTPRSTLAYTMAPSPVANSRLSGLTPDGSVTDSSDWRQDGDSEPNGELLGGDVAGKTQQQYTYRRT